MIQRQITNHKINNLLALIDCIRVLPEIILKSRHLEYRRSVIIMTLICPSPNGANAALNLSRLAMIAILMQHH
jgi:hypothetical protein